MSIASACGATEGPGAASKSLGSWRLVSFAVDGQEFPVDGRLFLEITDEGFSAMTTCNAISGQFVGELMSTAMGCPGARADGERYMSQAVRTVPNVDDDQMGGMPAGMASGVLQAHEHGWLWQSSAWQAFLFL
jgi:heat shock protein HslJ